MSVINWKNIHHFVPSEFPQDPELAEPRLIYTLDKLRESYGAPIYPSPVKGALARFGGSQTSQHYVGEDENHIVRNSSGIDIFIEGVPIHFFTCCIRHMCIKGIGVYLDTNGADGKPWVMFHIDVRELGYKINVPLLWIAEKVVCPENNKLKTKYRYPQLKPEYWSLLQDERLYNVRKRKN